MRIYRVFQWRRSQRNPPRPLALIAGVPICALLLPVASQGAAPPPAAGEEGMVVVVEGHACEVGREILTAGGNAADAAVAVAFALAVTHPPAGNLGGGGFLLYRPAAGKAEALDFRETAPARAHRDMFLGTGGRPDPNLSLWSPLAAGVPGSVAGLGWLHERHGTLPWSRLLAPAIRLAREGFVVDRFLAQRLRDEAHILGRHPESRRIFLAQGRFWQPGDTLRQPELAATLERIARSGPEEFYNGETAALLVAQMERTGGLITAEDLRSYRPVARKPLEGRYFGYTILAMPPPSSGGVAILEMLNILEGFPLSEWGWGSAQGCYVLAETMRRAFADRAAYLGDPDFVAVPVDGLTDRAYADSLRNLIAQAFAGRPDSVAPGRPRGWGRFLETSGGLPGMSSGEGGETTHFGIVDGEGNAVALTTTLNTSFGSGIVVEGAGFLLNNEMDDFTAQPGVPNYYGLVQGEANAIMPFKRPLSSMTPLMVLRPGRGPAAARDSLHLVLGSPGGPRIITSVLQVLLNVVTYGMGIQEAVHAPRLHHQWLPDTLYVEPTGWAADVLHGLHERGENVAVEDAFMGSVHAVQAARRGLLLGAPDPRDPGCACGVTPARRP